MMMGLMFGEVPKVSPKNKTRAEKYWLYGAPTEELAKAWDKPVALAELKKCANCEYFDNRVQTLKALKLDSGMGVCKKFSFACSQDAACQAWDCLDKSFEMEDEEKEDD
jgi:hypothetical protein